MSRATTCTYHCGACGRHFHSLAAFDAHRIGDYASNDPEIGRHCVSPLDVHKDGVMVHDRLTETGVCRLGEAPETDCTIWTMRGSTERARSVWGSAA